jgi:hypothetical protein
MEPVPVEVCGRSGGGWHGGFELLCFLPDGTVAVRSCRTGAVRNLPPSQWRDPLELATLRPG